MFLLGGVAWSPQRGPCWAGPTDTGEGSPIGDEMQTVPYRLSKVLERGTHRGGEEQVGPRSV